MYKVFIYIYYFCLFQSTIYIKTSNLALLFPRGKTENSNPSISVNSPVMEKTKRNFFSILLYYKLVKTSVKSNDKEFFCRAGVMY